MKLRPPTNDDKNVETFVRARYTGELSGAAYSAAEREITAAWTRDGKKIRAGAPIPQFKHARSLSIRGHKNRSESEWRGEHCVVARTPPWPVCDEVSPEWEWRKVDVQLTIGVIATGLALGWIAHEHGLISWIRKQLRSRRAWKQSRELGAPDPMCRRLGDEWHAIANDPNRGWM
jgi:hypothetical protein